MIEYLKAQIKSLSTKLFRLANPATQAGLKLYQVALSKLGSDASPKDLASDDLGCAESVSTVIGEAFPSFPVVLGTYELFTTLEDSIEFSEVFSPLPGDVIISPTGLGRNPSMPHGHTGIMGENGLIMSNNSSTGLWDTHFNLTSWRARYVQNGGYPVRFFRRLD